MSCCDCFEGPAPAGVEDMDTPGSVPINVQLSIGIRVKVYVLPSDTARMVKEKVEAVHGRQPDVAIVGKPVRPKLCTLRDKKRWVPVSDDATMAQLGMQPELRYADISDQLAFVKGLAYNAQFSG